MAKTRTNNGKSQIEKVYDVLASKGYISASDKELVDVLPSRGKEKPLAIIVLRALDTVAAKGGSV